MLCWIGLKCGDVLFWCVGFDWIGVWWCFVVLCWIGVWYCSLVLFSFVLDWIGVWCFVVLLFCVGLD